MTPPDLRAALTALRDLWIAMCNASWKDGPIQGDETGHAARWEAVDMCRKELDALLSEARPSPEPRVNCVDGFDAVYWNGSYEMLRSAICLYLGADKLADETGLVRAIERAGRAASRPSPEAEPATKEQK